MENTELGGDSTDVVGVIAWETCLQKCNEASTCNYWTYYANVESVDPSHRMRCRLYSSWRVKLTGRLSGGAIRSGTKECISGNHSLETIAV